MKDSWYVVRNKKRLGPFTKAFIQQKINQNQLLLTDLLWNEDFGNSWRQFATCKQLFDVPPKPKVEKNSTGLKLSSTFEIEADRMKIISMVITVCGLGAAFLPWRSAGIFSMNALQMNQGWFFITPFILSGVYICLNWNSFVRVPVFVSVYSLIMLAALIGAFSYFDFELPRYNAANRAFTTETINVAGFGYYLTAFCLFSLFVTCMATVTSRKE